MKTRIILCLALLLVLYPTQIIAASATLPPDTRYLGKGVWLVYPHGKSPDDPQRIQAIIELAKPGDTVRLAAGTFDFSEFENVRIAKDLTLKGAWDPKRLTPLTKIKNGFFPILIGRKTPINKPGTMLVNGHKVYHISTDVWARVVIPNTFQPYGTYNVFNDWVPVKVNVAQITFLRPYIAAIMTSGMKGGTIEKIRIESAWQGQLDGTHDGTNAGGILWYNEGALSIINALAGRPYDPALYAGTDLVRGNIIVQDSVFLGNYKKLYDNESDEEGDLPFVLYNPAKPVPPKGAYDKYVLQDLPTEWDSQNIPVPSSLQLFWVKKGFAVSRDNEGLNYADRGLSLGTSMLYSQPNLTLRRNLFLNCGKAIWFVLNGYKDTPLNATIENNQIISSPQSYYASGLWTVNFSITIPELGESWNATGDNYVVRGNTFLSTVPEGYYWDAMIRLASLGTVMIENNRLSMKSGVGITVAWPGPRAVISGNRISGSGHYAFFADWFADGNQFLSNDLSAFTPSGDGEIDDGIPPAQAVLFSNGNTLIAPPGETEEIVYDAGENNTVIGMTRLPWVFPESSAAQHLADPSLHLSQHQPH